MTWNYRIIRHNDKADIWYAIHEVYYNDVGEPKFVTQEPDFPFGKNVSELKKDFKYFLESFEKPILNFEDF